MTRSTSQSESRWPHRFAWAVVAATFPLIWVGGLVTTYAAGMAVPDWPNTYGYNLFLYPWQTWLFGPWDLFIEHGHRLLAALVGMLTIGLALSLWLARPTGALRWLGWVALAAVIGQGVLGGMRVLMDERLLAKFHACTGPAFFALAVGILAATSSAWRDTSKRITHAGAGALRATASLTTLLAYLQLVLGAHLRHVGIAEPPSAFRAYIIFHVALAAVLLLLSIKLTADTWLRFRAVRRLPILASILCLLVAGQIALGAGTWLVNYSWPWPGSAPAWLAGYTIVARGQLQALTTTGHVALGSLILVASLALTLWSWRRVGVPLAVPRTEAAPLASIDPSLTLRRPEHQAELLGLAATGGAL